MLPKSIATASLFLGAGAAACYAAESPRIVGTPAAAYVASSNNGARSYTMSVVARFSQALPADGARVIVGPGLRKGQQVTKIYGGDQPHRIGTTSKHCYLIEAGRPRPVTQPKSGARWQVALLRGRTVVDTATVTLRPLPRDRAFGPREAKHMGC